MRGNEFHIIFVLDESGSRGHPKQYGWHAFTIAAQFSCVPSELARACDAPLGRSPLDFCAFVAEFRRTGKPIDNLLFLLGMSHGGSTRARAGLP